MLASVPRPSTGWVKNDQLTSAPVPTAWNELGDGSRDYFADEEISTELLFLDENNEIKKVRIYPKKSKSLNLAFDVTPAKLVTGLITEKGVCEASEKGLKGLFK